MSTFLYRGRKITLALLTPKQVHDDQVKIQQECEKVDERKKLKSSRENRGKDLCKIRGKKQLMRWIMR